MPHTITIEVQKVHVDEELRREKAFLAAANSAAVSLSCIAGLNIPTVIHPGKRVKSRKEMLMIEKPAIESRRPQAIKRKSRQGKKERVSESIKRMAQTIEPQKDKGNMHSGKKQKKMRPGKSKRQKINTKKTSTKKRL